MRGRRLLGTAAMHARAGVASALAITACASGEAPSSAPLATAAVGTRSQAQSRGVGAARDHGAAAAAALTDTAIANAAGHPDAGEPPGSDPDGSADAGGSDPTGPSNDCCTPSSATAGGGGGCSDEAVAACVCQGDPFCCSTEYDNLCVNQAVSRCGQDCDDRPPVSDCCSPSGVPGCTDDPVATCICEIDPFCCVFRFDQNCVNLGVSRCGLSCGVEEARP